MCVLEVPTPAKARPVLRYHGGKWRLAPWILQHLPPHRVYVEPFCGAASVLMRKPRAYAEVINDLDGEIVNLFRVLQSPEAAAELRRRLYLTPFAREEFELAYQETPDPVERARRLVVRSQMGFGSAATNRSHSTGFRADSTKVRTTPAHNWRDYPDHVPTFVERLRGVVIEHRPALDVIAAHDGPEVLFYVDPPYVRSTRELRQRDLYAHEMTDADHQALALRLQAVQGMVVLSGYPSELYRELFAGWRRVEREALADGAQPRTEVLWLNEAAARRLQAGGAP